MARLRKLHLAALRLRVSSYKLVLFRKIREEGEFVIVYRELKSVERDLGFCAGTLYGISNNLERHYRNAFIPKKDGTKRKLSVPDFILKKVQKSIYVNILSYYPVSRFAYGYVYGTSVQKNAAVHIGHKKILKLDIEGFFDNISYSQVKDKVFYKEKFSEPVRILLTMLCYYRDALPQGAPSSPAITNIIMYDFDESVGAFCEERGVAYTRYCDDMTFSGDFDEKEIISFVKSKLKTLNLFLKNRKTKVVPCSDRQTVTGIVVNEKVNLAKEYKKTIRREMYFIRKFGIDAHISRIGLTDKRKYLASLRGRVSYVLQTVPGSAEFSEYKKILSKTY